MSNTGKLRRWSRGVNLRAALLFLLAGLFIIIFTLSNWFYDLRPRLVDEAQSNIRVLTSFYASSIESRLQNIDSAPDNEFIRTSLREMMLINDPTSGDNLFKGVTLTVDYDAFPTAYEMVDFDLGASNCVDCIVAEVPIFHHASGERIALLTTYAKPVLHQRLVEKVSYNLGIMLAGVILVLGLGWMNANRLTRSFADRELKLTHEIAERARDEAHQHQIESYDQLTKLPNRQMLKSEFRKKIEESSRHRKSLATLLFDLDFFKEVNDLHGHEAGNELLTQVADRMSRVTRNYDLLSRIGGDEFVVVISGLNDRADIIQVVEKIIASLSAPFKLEKTIINATTSVGISMYPEDGLDTSKLLRNADLAMHRAKAEGRNCYQFFNAELNLELQYSRWVETTLRDALEHNSLELQYQPQFNVDSGEIDSAEAVIRWPHGDGDKIQDSDFIRNAERSGLISDVSHWVLQEVCRQQCEWRDKGLENIRININLSRKDFGEKGVLYRFLQTLQHYNLRPEQIGIEIAENAFRESDEQLTKSLEMLHQSGVYISLDDFGAGGSSLNDLRRLPLSGIKLDPSFVTEAPSSERDITIMQAITMTGHGFGLDVVVEGVDSEWQETLCKDMGCTAIQGNHISEPLTADQFAQQHLRAAIH